MLGSVRENRDVGKFGQSPSRWYPSMDWSQARCQIRGHAHHSVETQKLNICNIFGFSRKGGQARHSTIKTAHRVFDGTIRVVPPSESNEVYFLCFICSQKHRLSLKVRALAEWATILICMLIKQHGLVELGSFCPFWMLNSGLGHSGYIVAWIIFMIYMLS